MVFFGYLEEFAENYSMFHEMLTRILKVCIKFEKFVDNEGTLLWILISRKNTLKYLNSIDQLIMSYTHLSIVCKTI